MKKTLLSIFLITSLTLAQNRTKSFIYFKDKGIDKTAQLSKSSHEYHQAVSLLSERSIKRRIKNFGENIITYEDLPIKSEYIEAINSSGAKIVWKLKWFNALSAYLTEKQFTEISSFAFVDKIEKVKTIDYRRDEKLETSLHKRVGVSNSKYNLNYGPSLAQVELSDVPIIHDAGFSGEGVLIGILDAGFAWQDHPALQSRDILAERDFVNGDDITDDGDASHGTAVFSLIGGFDEGNIIGPAFDAQYVLAKTEYIYSETHVEEDNYAAALEWMDSIGVDIATTSLGYSEFDEGEGDYTYADMDGKTTIVTRASELAFSRGILTISSAGNEGNKSWKYITAPSDGFNTLAVGAVSSDGSLAAFSSVGPTSDGRIKPEFVTQGVGCYHARAYSNDYKYGSGTSYSAPIASGIASQLLSAFPYLSNEQLRKTLILASDSLNNPNNKYGYGLLSAKRALEYPNIKLAGTYEFPSINKLFLDSLGVFEDSVFILYTINSEEKIYRSKMVNRGNSIYSFYYEGDLFDKVNFEFEYLDSTLVLKYSPPEGKYSFINGTTDVIIDINGSSNPIFNDFKLSQNYPNPFNPLTRFELSVPEEMFVSIVVYNILGQKVKTITTGYLKPGAFQYYWDGSNDFGGKVSTGVYIYSASSKTKITSKKMVFLK